MYVKELQWHACMHATNKPKTSLPQSSILNPPLVHHFHSFSRLSISTSMAALSFSLLPPSPLASNSISFYPPLILAHMGRLFTAPSLASRFQFPRHSASLPRPCRQLIRAPVTMKLAAPLISPHDHWGIYSAVLSIATFGIC